jgi:hypothetical protein
MAYVGQPTICGHEEVHAIPGTALEAVRICHVMPDGWKPEHEHHYGGFVLRITKGREGQ